MGTEAIKDGVLSPLGKLSIALELFAISASALSSTEGWICVRLSWLCKFYAVYYSSVAVMNILVVAGSWHISNSIVMFFTYISACGSLGLFLYSVYFLWCFGGAPTSCNTLRLLFVGVVCCHAADILLSTQASGPEGKESEDDN